MLYLQFAYCPGLRQQKTLSVLYELSLTQKTPVKNKYDYK